MTRVVAFCVFLTVGLIAHTKGSSHFLPHSQGGALVLGQTRVPLPHVMLWAWERPEDLRFLNPHTAGVAFLAGTIEIRSSLSKSATALNANVLLRPRLQPLLIPHGTSIMAVVRIETLHDLWHAAKNPSNAVSPYTFAQRQRVSDMIVSFARLRGVRAIQIDYDATRSERVFYAELLEDVRARLPQGMLLSMTALASWCIGDRWLDALPSGTIDEAVPMLFRMGTDAAGVASFLQTGNQFPSLACRTSLGISTDEAFSQELLRTRVKSSMEKSTYRRVYVFSNKEWTPADVRRIIAEIEP